MSVIILISVMTCVVWSHGFAAGESAICCCLRFSSKLLRFFLARERRQPIVENCDGSSSLQPIERFNGSFLKIKKKKYVKGQ